MIYVYALVEPPCNPSRDARGLEGRPLESVAQDNVAAVVTRHADKAPTRPSTENLWTHEKVVEALTASGGVLPMRFGSTFPDDRRLRETLSRHAAALEAGFDRVRGCVELGLRVVETPAADDRPRSSAPTAQLSPPATGRAYMLARLAAERQRQGDEARATRLSTQLHEALFPLARDAVQKVRSAPGLLLTAAYLVPRDTADAFARRVRELATAHPALRLLCTGPWPAYHFTPSLPVAEAPDA